jgi:hypothetical protein
MPLTAILNGDYVGGLTVLYDPHDRHYTIYIEGREGELVLTAMQAHTLGVTLHNHTLQADHTKK